MNITVLSGQAHPRLAQDIAARLGLAVSPTDFKRFSNDCQWVQIQANCRESDVFIIQPLVPPVQEHLMELLLMLDAARGASARRITAVIPYFAYARSDKKDAPRISIAARMVADLLVTAGANRVLTMTLHSAQVHGFFSVPVDHLNALQVLAEHFRRQDLGDVTVVSPDLGNAKEASHFARMLGVPVAAGNKRRISDDKTVIESIVGEVRGRRCIVLDDEVANGGSMLTLIPKLREFGATRFSLTCTHGLFSSDAIPRMAALDDVDEIVTTNTIPLEPAKMHPKVTQLSIAPLFSEAIRRIHAGESISGLFGA
ncbi:MAG: ribose-phosphate pyrophosphokinase [Fimbriimonadaceae bacterium]